MKTELAIKAKDIKLILTDCDGVLTDNGVYYSKDGEVMKRFSIRDGMGVERLRNEIGVDTGIITGETSGSVVKRAEKLQIQHLYLGIKNKREKLLNILAETGLKGHEIGYIGDDVNDIEIMHLCGLTACPADAMFQVKEIANYICNEKGGRGAFREFAELIIGFKKQV
jgi:3-deoxy-D-manno-octulosonate 8-phosphate phosphatase (KDO 8-P phosphatase)